MLQLPYDLKHRACVGGSAFSKAIDDREVQNKAHTIGTYASISVIAKQIQI